MPLQALGPLQPARCKQVSAKHLANDILDSLTLLGEISIRYGMIGGGCLVNDLKDNVSSSFRVIASVVTPTSGKPRESNCKAGIDKRGVSRASASHKKVYKSTIELSQASVDAR